MCISSWGRKESDTTERLNGTELMATLFLVFKGTFILFSIEAALIYIPINSLGGLPFLHTLSSICYL